jgi:transposase
MFIRKKKNKSGVISIQIIDKSRGRYKVYKTIGSSADAAEIERLLQQARNLMPQLTAQSSIHFDALKEKEFEDAVFDSIKDFTLTGPELILGKLFNEIGFNAVKDELFRHMVITRLIYPVSKLKTIDYLYKYKGIMIERNKIYRYLDKINSMYKEQIQQISYHHTLMILNNALSVVFYDVTTLYFEIEEEDDLRKAGFSKEGRHQHPQILLGLLVSTLGYPLAYEIFEGNKFEGHTMLPVIEAFKNKYQIESLVVIADAGLLSNDNIEQLQSKGYKYILGARIKNESLFTRKQILSLSLGNGESVAFAKDEQTRIIVSYSATRAKKDEQNRKKGVQKLEKAVASGKLSKKNIHNRGYNKYLKLEGDVKITIDYDKYKADAPWDGLKGYITNTDLSKDDVIENYRHLWMIEKAFRISKTDLRIRPIYHRRKHRIEAHICIAFCAYKIYKELERQLNFKQAEISAEKALDILKTIYALSIQTPYSKDVKTRLIIKNEEQKHLLNLFDIKF